MSKRGIEFYVEILLIFAGILMCEIIFRILMETPETTLIFGTMVLWH